MEDKDFDAIVIGGGPSGLFSALELAGRGRRTALLEKGGYMSDSLCPKVTANVSLSNLRSADKFRAQCSRCTCLEGIGGAAFHFDSNLGYISKLSRSKIERLADGSVRPYSGLERTFDSFEEAQGLISEVNERFFEFGLPRQFEAAPGDDAILRGEGVFTHIDTEGSLPVTLDKALVIIQRMERALEEMGVPVLVRTPVERIERGRGRRWRVVAEREGRGTLELEADSVVIGVGKSALPWVLKVLDDLDIEFEESDRVDVGVRLETKREDLFPITNACFNPKLTFLSRRGEPVRTFCVCDGGRLMQYTMAGVNILDGQHCINDPTSKTNFGLLTTVTLPEGVNNTEYALNFARTVNLLGQGRPVVQRLGDLLEGRPTASLAGNEVQTSLVSYAPGDMAKCLPAFLVEDILDMVKHLNEIAPGSVRPYALLVAPVIERLYPSIRLDPHMETNQPGIFIVGDSSGKIIGITYGAATGLRAARAILDRYPR